MANPTILLFLLLGVIFAGKAGCSILCVRCDSINDRIPGDCVKRYPSPSTCGFQTGDQQFCQKVIEYNKDNTQKRFVRDCTSVTESQCMETSPEAIAAGAAARICNEVCNTDGCNHSIRLTPSFVLSLFFLCLIVVARLNPLPLSAIRL